MLPQPRPDQTIRTSIIASLLLLLTAPIVCLADEEKVEITDNWPSCQFERLGTVESKDGRKVGASVGASKRANLERAEARLLRKAKKLDATRIVFTQRNIQRDGERIRYIHLIGIAIGPCQET